ncbi:MAG: tetratricopeptide repeat protein [Pyrinomonadaceae bacterium]|nr:tetratricopeptide repeat protein [Pyrinomonadaceae bacterium]
MHLHESIPVKTRDLGANTSEPVEVLCARAKELAEAGEFETARSTIGQFWNRVGERPRLDGLDESAQAELLLRAGALSGWIGSAQQIWGAQEAAKDLISESASIFEKLGLDEKVAEARIDMAICYWREGGYDEARVTLQQILESLGDQPSEQKLRALLNCGLVERSSLRYHDSLRIHREAASLFNESSNHALRGKFHNEFATVLTNLGLSERREDYIDQALVEYAAASFHAEQAGNRRFLALVENNVGFLFVSVRRFDEAHEHLDHARSLFADLKDKGMVAQVDDTRARAFIGQGRFAEAESVARGAVRVLEDGDELSLLAEALTTHGRALAKLGNAQLAHSKFSEALATAQRAGDPQGAGVAALSIGEELADQLPHKELCSYYRMAESLLAESQYPEIKVRLGECARLLMRLPLDQPVLEVRHQTNGKGSAKEQAAGTPTFTNSGPEGPLEELVLNYEGDLIKRALEASGGSVTRAARLLGITHQGLAFILNGRHRNLLSVRTPVKPRRRSIIRYR